MPTKPLGSILDRDLSRAKGREAIELMSPLLQELVNYATNELERCAASLPQKIDENVAILVLYRHMIEMTDGIEVLLSQSCSYAAIPLLRSSFEALLSLEYILQSDTDYTERSLSWLVYYVHQGIEAYERLDPSTNRGRETKVLFDTDIIVSNVPKPPRELLWKLRENLQTILARPHIQQIELEYSKNVRVRNWYQLFGGPADLRALAARLKRGGQYEILYRLWSTTAHAQDFQSFIDVSDGRSAINRSRDPNEIGQIAGHAANLILEGTRRILMKTSPGGEKAWGTWYVAEVSERYLKLWSPVVPSWESLA